MDYEWRGKEISEVSRFLGHKTNNEAEYWALLLGLREAKRLGGSIHPYLYGFRIGRKAG